MSQVKISEPTAKDSTSTEYKAAVADHGPSMEQAVFAMAKALCERLGPNACPFSDTRRDGICVANWSPCVCAKRQPTAEEIATAQADYLSTAAKAPPKSAAK